MKKTLEKWNKRFHNIKPRLLITQLIVTLIYPVAKAAISEYNRLLIFTDSLTIIAAVLLIAGVVYSLYLHGDFDISGFVLKRGMRSEEKKPFGAYMDDKKREREESFNYPLFLAALYFAVSIIIAYLIL